MRTQQSTRAGALEQELSAIVRGEVRFDAGARALYSTDASNYRQVPIGVVTPKDAADVEAAVEICRRHEAPVLARGAGTSLAGQCCNAAVVIDMSRHMHGIVDLDPDARRATVLPGTVLDDLRRAAEVHHLTFGPDPATHDRCTLGGMIGNDSCGTHSIIAGRTVHNVEQLEILTYDGLRLTVGPTPEAELEAIIAAGGRRGEIYARLAALRDRYGALVRQRYPDIPRRVSGYNLDQLLPENGFNVARALVGSESTCVLVLSAVVRLVPSPPARAVTVLGFPDVFEAADAVPAVMEHGPIGLEGFDGLTVEAQRRQGLNLAELELLPPGCGGYLLAETGAEDPASAIEAARRIADAMAARGTAARVATGAEAGALWRVREAALGASARVPGEAVRWEGWEDAAVAPERLGEYLRGLKQLENKYGYSGMLYGHFGHGCVHARIDFDLSTRSGVAAYRLFVEEAADLVVGLGGSLSGEHGDGQSRGELLVRMFGPELVGAFEEYKSIWDPAWKMNPGKVVRPRPLDEDLRHGPEHRPWKARTSFALAEDGGDLARAVSRCVGVGKCRKTEAGTMCPSYMATREEQHSTRGRARLLFEMLEGDVIGDGWRSREVAEALELCLSCKACKRECPVGVDMATYKSEFLSHHFAGRLRPRAHYSMGLLPLWGRIAARAPRLANAAAHLAGSTGAARLLGGVDPRRALPSFAEQTFREWFESSRASRLGAAAPPGSPQAQAEPVVLWVDTFTDLFSPGIGIAAVSVLEAAGFSVSIPERPVCCGLTMISTGMLATAKRRIRRSLSVMEPHIAAGSPVVGLEPSCTAALRSDVPDLLGRDERARSLAASTVTLAELLAARRPAWRPPRLDLHAILQPHCHHRAVMGTGPDERLLGAAVSAHEVLDAGCCGLAGNFGFEDGHFELSMAIGERVLLPAVRAAAPESLVVADGFSCRTQIEQGTGRRALHLAQVLAMGLDAAASPSPQGRRPAPSPPA